MRKRRWIRWVGGAAIVVCAAGALSAYRRATSARVVDVLPAFTEPGPGPRAPHGEAFGFAVGELNLAEAQAKLSAAGISCADTSIRALMAQMREAKRREVAASQARGEAPDAVSGASALKRRSPKESNPQVRLSCEETPGPALRDRARAEAPGRLLLVFDSPAHPLRHASFERTFAPTAHAEARAELIAARRALEAAFGPPHTTAPKDGPVPDVLPWLSAVEAEWRFADLRVRVSALNYGARGVVVSELVEVPWPVRAERTQAARYTQR